jgi:hypothetical protein
MILESEICFPLGLLLEAFYLYLQIKKLPFKGQFFERTISNLIYCPIISEPEWAESLMPPDALQALAAVLNAVQAAVLDVLQAIFAAFTDVLKADQAAFTAVITAVFVEAVYACCKALALVV